MNKLIYYLKHGRSRLLVIQSSSRTNIRIATFMRSKRKRSITYNKINILYSRPFACRRLTRIVSPYHALSLNQIISILQTRSDRTCIYIYIIHTNPGIIDSHVKWFKKLNMHPLTHHPFFFVQRFGYYIIHSVSYATSVWYKRVNNNNNFP